MSGKSTVIALLAAISLFMLARGAEPGIAVVAFFIVGVGITGMVSAALRRRELPRASGALEERLLQLEKRAQVTEDELAATNHLLTSLTAERDFDRQLHGASHQAFPRSRDDPGKS